MRKRKLLLFICAGVLTIFGACEKIDIDDVNLSEEQAKLRSTYLPDNWMGAIDDAKKLSELSIPGSHDAGAMYEPWPGTAICQDLTIPEQLEAGTRFLDIRCRHIDDYLVIHHGSIYQHLNLDDVLGYCWDFLSANPSECIIMSIKEEYDPSNNTRTFQETFNSYVAKNPNGWYLGATVPPLGNVRGKIALFRRFSNSSSLGLAATPGWADNTTFSINHYTTFRVQDNYQVSSNSSKWDAIKSLFNEAVSGSTSTLYVNFTSGYQSILWIPSITAVSNQINPWLINYFKTTGTGRFGIVPMDFSNAELNKYIIDTNF